MTMGSKYLLPISYLKARKQAILKERDKMRDKAWGRERDTNSDQVPLEIKLKVDITL